MTKAQQLGIEKFPYVERDLYGRRTYHETKFGYWVKAKYDLSGYVVYWENSKNRGFVKKFDENGRLISEVNIKIWKQIQKRNSIIDSLL